MLAEKFDYASDQFMDESETASTRPDLPATLPDPLAPAKTPATARAQRLATALRDNLKRRKAAGRAGKPARPSN
ncbi:MAG: hypothetical protein Q8K49_08580 [Brevundimonas sp.]|nr:hypothetical protein [Brevundimonas sp.]